MQDEILRLIPEPANSVDRNAVAVMKEGRIVGHVPFNLAPIISLFLRRDVNKAFARVIGGKVNGGAGYGLETINGPKPYVHKIQEVFHFLKISVLV